MATQSDLLALETKFRRKLVILQDKLETQHIRIDLLQAELHESKRAAAGLPDDLRKLMFRLLYQAAVDEICKKNQVADIKEVNNPHMMDMAFEQLCTAENKNNPYLWYTHINTFVSRQLNFFAAAAATPPQEQQVVTTTTATTKRCSIM